jgi:anti-sigma factor RsiW
MRASFEQAREMWNCRWSSLRLQRYLTSDVDARLDAKDFRRIEAHVAQCERCTTSLKEYRGLTRGLAGWAARRVPDADAIERARETARTLAGS